MCRPLRRAVLVDDRLQEDLVDLLQVRRHIVRAFVLRPLRSLRIDDDGDAVIVRRTDDVLAGVLRARALAVVRDDDAVHALVQLLINVGEVLLRVRTVDGLYVLKVQPQHLLMPADDADLRRRRTLRMDESCIVNAARFEFIQQAVAVRIPADIARDADVRPKERQVVRDVCRPAERLAHPRHVGDRHRRLGGDARHLARIILVEHDIADDEDVAARALFGNDAADFFHIHENAPICSAVNSNERPDLPLHAVRGQNAHLPSPLPASQNPSVRTVRTRDARPPRAGSDRHTAK